MAAFFLILIFFKYLLKYIFLKLFVKMRKSTMHDTCMVLFGQCASSDFFFNLNNPL